MPHCRRYLLVCTKPHDTGGGSTTLEIIGGRLTIVDNLHKQTTAHSVPSAEEARRVCRYLVEVVLHQMLVSESAVPVDGESPHLRPSPLIHQLRAVFKRLHVDEEAHHLDIVVLHQLVNVRIVG